jgi:hypothetical protein
MLNPNQPTGKGLCAMIRLPTAHLLASFLIASGSATAGERSSPTVEVPPAKLAE